MAYSLPPGDAAAPYEYPQKGVVQKGAPHWPYRMRSVVVLALSQVDAARHPCAGDQQRRLPKINKICDFGPVVWSDLRARKARPPPLPYNINNIAGHSVQVSSLLGEQENSRRIGFC
jgi:hypothetical protein